MSLKKIDDGICGYVAGGLGNQLFMLAAAWKQADRLQCPLYVDTSHSTINTGRPFELSSFSSPAIELQDRSPWRTIKVSKTRSVPIPKRWNPKRQNLYIEKNVALFDSKINNVGIGTSLIGYFQSPKYFEGIETELINSINNFKYSNEELSEINSISSNEMITLHLRRGDYLNTGKSRDLVTSIEYAKRSISLLRSLGINHQIRVFSDSPEYVINELRHLDEDFVIGDSEKLLSPLATIKAMSMGTSMIMSNSTFSWWAAWLMSSRTSNNSKVIAPRPWLQTGQSRADLLMKEWITLDARS